MRVRIYKPSASAMQSGNAKTHKWVLEFDKLALRRPEDLMGWTMSDDTLNQVQLSFDTQEQAMEFAQEKDWEYTILKAQTRKIKPRNYMDNYKYIPAENSSGK